MPPVRENDSAAGYLSEQQRAAVLASIGEKDRDTYFIKTVAHGAYINALREEVSPQLDHILVTQERHLEQLSDYAKSTQRELTPDPGAAHQDAVITHAERIARWVRELNPPGEGSLFLTNAVLQKIYEEEILKLDGDLLTVSQELATTQSGFRYIEQCLTQGVPLPETMQFSIGAPVYDPADGKPPLETWINWGMFGQEFVFPDRDAQLWSMEFNDGVCLALPRWTGVVSFLTGIICLGYQTGKVCYFDNVDLRDGESRPLSSAISGAALAGHYGGECSDCHAGNNPFVVHPEYAPFKNLLDSQVSLASPIWPDPIVPASWVENPGPMRSLGPVPNGQRSCDTCHNTASNSNLPELSSLLDDYCPAIITTAVQGGNGASATMPMSTSTGAYDAHLARIQALCNSTPGGSTPTSNVPDDDPNVVSPPTVRPPLYACSRSVSVRGARIGSEVTLYVETNPVASQVVVDPDRISFTLTDPLEEGQSVTATQTIDGQTSDPSKVVTVLNHMDDYPDGLPAPTITPKIFHECGDTIAVRHVPGAQLVIEINQGETRYRHGDGGGFTTVQAARDFDPGDMVRVKQTMCEGNDESDFSEELPALTAPNQLPPFRLDPPDLHDNQESIRLLSLTHSASTFGEELTSGSSTGISSNPFSSHSFFMQTFMQRPVNAMTDNFEFVSELCSASSPPLLITQIKSCKELPPLKIQQPLDGDEFIVVESAIPGATIRVWSERDDEEIGDGGGEIIALTRALEFGEQITVVQQLGECVDSLAYTFTVR